MKAQTEIFEAGAHRPACARVRPAPSLRVPVTAANRALLRWLREAESSAWEAGYVCDTVFLPPEPSPAAHDYPHS